MFACHRPVVAVLTLVAILLVTPEAPAARSGGFSLVPIGVVGGNPPGTVISGNEITISGGGVDVLFEIRAFWGGEPGLRLGPAQCKIDATNGFSSGVGAPLTWKNQGIPGNGLGTQTVGAFVPEEVCEVSQRYGCPSPGTPDSGQAPCDGLPGSDGDCDVNPRFVLAPEANPLTAVAFLVPDYEYIAVTQAGGALFTGTNELLGIAVFRVPPAAAGTYTIGFVADPLTTLMADPNVDDIPLGPVAGSFANLTPGKITVPTGACCDYNSQPASCTENATAATCPPPRLFRLGQNCSDTGGSPGTADACECCSADNQCDDSDACTTDDCQFPFPGSVCGQCVNIVNFDTTTFCCNPANGQTAAPVDDGNPCTIETCSITPLGPDDGDGRGVPAHFADVGAPCDDGLRCVINDVCQGDGSCDGLDLITKPCVGDFNCPAPSTGCNLGTGFCDCSEVAAPPLPVTTYPHGAAKQRYISFAPGQFHDDVAYFVIDVGSGSAYYASTPRTSPSSVVGQGLTFLVSDTAPPLYDWASLPAVHVGGCLIAPGDAPGVGREYEVRATYDGVNFSSPLSVFTAARPTLANARFWADVSGSFSLSGNPGTTPPTPPNSWEPADQANPMVSGFDITASLQGASSAPTQAHFTWTDVDPFVPDRVANGPDTLRVVNSFRVGTAKEWYPYAYPEAPTPIHGPTPPSPATCPPPPLMAGLNP